MIVGDKVTYHGSLPEYHPYVFEIAELFEFAGEECCRLQGPSFTIWVARCRVKNIKPYDGEFDYYHDKEYDGEYFNNTVWLETTDQILDYLYPGVIT